MTAPHDFADRLQSLIERAGGKRPLARQLGVSDGAISAWVAGSVPYDSTLAAACARSGVDFRWLRDGEGSAEFSLARIRPPARRGQTFTYPTASYPQVIREEPPGADAEPGWLAVLRVLAAPLTATQLSAAIQEVLGSDVELATRAAAARTLHEVLITKIRQP